jgi:cephalosporin hydroxylase
LAKKWKNYTHKTLLRNIRKVFNRRDAFKRLAAYHSNDRSLEERIDWAMSFGGHGYYRIKTLQIKSEILALAREVEALRPKTIMEIGTARGGTLLIWSSLASEKAISCDMQDMSIQGELLTALPPKGSTCEVVLLSGNSHEDSFRQQVEAELKGKQVDFLFIDGDHTEKGVEADYRDYRHLVRPGGIIAFHDIVENQPLDINQVYYFWQRLKKEVPITEEFVSDSQQCGFGIGIVRVPAEQ